MIAGESLLDVARKVVALAKTKGAQDASASAARARDVDIEWRDGKLEKITESTTRGVSVALYVDGRYSAVSTSDLRPEALDKFLTDAVALTRAIAPDPDRRLPDPELYAGQATVDLQFGPVRRRHHDVVTALAGHQLGVDDLVVVEVVVADLDAGFLLEGPDRVLGDVVGPVVDVENLVLFLGLHQARDPCSQGGQPGQAQRGERSTAQAIHEQPPEGTG